MKRMHTGWSADEDALLLSEAQRAKEEHTPLQAAFDAVGAKTARRPNSVRNRYYGALKARTPGEPLFVPFTDDESDALLREVLKAQAEGLSVRACTLRLAGGDMRRMLRYQNKYRALLRSDPDRVRRVRDALSAEGVPTPDPYRKPDPHTPRVGRPPLRPNPVPAPAMEIRRLLDALYDELVALHGEHAQGA